MKYIGQDVKVAITAESTPGTIPTVNSGDWIRWADISIASLQENETIEANLGHIFTEGERQVTKRGYEVEITAKLEDMHIGKFLKGMFGTVTTTAGSPEAGVNTHAFTIDDSSIPQTYTLSLIMGSEQRQFPYGVLTSLVVKQTAGGVGEVVAKFTTKNYSTASGLTVSYPDNHTFAPCSLNVYEASSYSGLGSATAREAIQSIEISFTRDTNTDTTVSSCEPEAILGLSWALQANYEKQWDSSDSDRTEVENLTSKAFKFVFENTNVTIGSSTHPEFDLVIPSGIKEDFGRDVALKQVIGSKFAVKPDAQDLTNGYALANLINTISGY